MAKNIVKVKKHSYVLDWFEVTDVEIDLDKFSSFELQLRTGGDWYLKHYIHVSGQMPKNVYEHDFRLARPKEAIEVLGTKLRRFASLHTGGRYFTRELTNLFR